MKIKILKRWQMSAVGDVIDPPENIATALIDRGIAECLIIEDAPKKKEKKKGIAHGPVKN